MRFDLPMNVAQAIRAAGGFRPAVVMTTSLALGLSLLLGGCPVNDSAARVAPTIEPASGPAAGGTAVTIRGENFVDASGVLFGDVAAAEFAVVNDKLITAVTPAHDPGAVEVTILPPAQPFPLAAAYGAPPTAPVAAGTFAFLAPEPPAQPVAPALTALRPTQGPLAGGTRVTIEGAALQAGSTVLFGDRLATEVAIENATLVTAVTPAQAAPGVLDVTLVGPNGQRATLEAAFEYLPPPPAAELAVDAITPTAGPLGGGTVITIEGRGFESDMAVLLGGRQATGVEFVNAGLLVAETPAGEPGLATLTVETDDGRQVSLSDAFEYLAAIEDPGTDTDGDGLTDLQETMGYEIRLDLLGFGMNPRHLVTRQVTSDPTDPDTDGDGLDDRAELVNRTDPRNPDTDGDGLFDAEEVFRWLTSPISVDTDGDARGPAGDLPPNASLFDGNELVSARDNQGRLVDASGQPFLDGAGNPLPPRDIVRVVLAGTSPTLDDTDGDGASDFEEFDDPVRNAILADVPQAQIRIVDDVQASLFIEYAESEGQETEYGSTLSQGTSETLSTSDTIATSTTLSSSATLGFSISAKPGVNAEATAGVAFTEEESTSFSQSSTTETQQTFSQYQRESRELTETASRGELRMGVQITNTGTIAYQLRNLAFTVRQFVPEPGNPDRSGSYRTVGTLQPVIPDFTLGPGSSTDVIEVSATDVNPDLIKQFMARPSAFSYSTIGFELENAEGINFTFLTENTYSRTALLVLDYGDGTVDRFRVATNVDRDPQTAAFTGVTMRRVMEEILGIGYETTDPGVAGGAYLETIVRPDGTRLESDFQFSRWVVFGSPGLDVETTDFEDIVLRNRDELRLVYIQDRDRDGLLAREEFVYGTRDDTQHSDGDPAVPGDVGDGLTDFEEIRVGWDVTVGGMTYRVLSDPRRVDTDGDGLDDGAERAAGTDPNNPDTDLDGLPDSVDDNPTIPAGRFYVWAAATGAGDGSSWADAYLELSDATTQAALLNTNGDPADDISEIWVAAGTYAGPVTVPSNVAVFGGFAGGETRVRQRDPNPASNGCIVAGGSEVAILDGVGPATVFDGFLLINGGDGLEVNNSVVTLRNLIVLGNDRGIDVVNDAHLTLIDSIVSSNASNVAPGIYVANSRLDAINVEIADNTSAWPDTAGGLHAGEDAIVTLTDCRFLRNRSTNEFQETGGGAYVDGTAVLRAFNTAFRQNTVQQYGGGGMAIYGDVLLVNCAFWRNEIIQFRSAGAIYVGDEGVAGHPGLLYAINCSFNQNRAGSNRGSGGVFVGRDRNASTPNDDARGVAFVLNSVLYGNLMQDGVLRDDESAQIDGDRGATLVVRDSIVSDALSRFVGNGNLGADPSFANPTTGNLRLGSGSPAIDLGNNLVDADPFTPGLQFLPVVDLSGLERTVDGDGDGDPRVDMGAYEVQITD